MIAFAGVSSRLSSAAVGGCCGGCSCAFASAPRMAQPRINVDTNLLIWQVLYGSVPLLSETEQVADLHEQLAAVIEISAGCIRHEARGPRSGGNHVQILQVAVVANINRGPRMHEVRD